MRFYIVLLLVIFIPFKSNAVLIKYGNNHKAWRNVNWQNVRFYKGPDGSIDASLAENEYSGKRSGDILVLHFNNKNEIALGKRIKRFTVDKSNVIIDKRRSRFGTGAALFYKTNDSINLKLNELNFFEKSVDTGPFTMEFWLHPFSRNDGDTIFQKYGPVYKNNRVLHYSGVRAYFYKGRLVWEFKNMFRDLNNKNRFAQVRIISSSRIKLYKWSHHALTYNPVNGKLTYYINGMAVNTVFCTDTGEADSTILAPGFSTREYGMLVIGKQYQGLLDEFTITSRVKHRFRLNKYVGSMGLIRSGIIDLESTGTAVKWINIKYKARKGAGIILEYRISNRYYNPDKPETIFPWREYNLETPMTNNLIRGRYFQWRIKLLSAENGKYSPIINNIRMRFTTDRVPFKPIGITAVSYNRNIYLKWQGNTEPDVVGYKIYYGRKKGMYNGTLAMQGFSPIQIPVSSLKNPLLPRIALTGLKVNALYYIRLTAYDKSGQESPFSEEIFIRVKRFKNKIHAGIFRNTSD